MTFIFVALGGAVGACGRYAISLIPVKSHIVGIAESRNVSKNAMMFLKTGICGGFTTFSTFSLEAYNILSTKNYGLCGLYVALSVVGCIAGVWCGKKLANLV